MWFIRSILRILDVIWGLFLLVVIAVVFAFCSTMNESTQRNVERQSDTATAQSSVDSKTMNESAQRDDERMSDTAPAQNTLDKVARTLTVLARTPISKQAYTIKKFRLIVRQIIHRCSDIQDPEKAGGSLLVYHNFMDDAGLGKEEDLLSFSNNLHRLLSIIFSHSSTARTSITCAEVFTIYVQFRLDGLSPREAIQVALLASEHVD